MEVLLPILSWLLPIVAAILTLTLAALAKNHIGKVGVERSQQVDNMIDKYVGIAVSAAQRLAETALDTQSKTLTGESKKAHAVKVVLAELDQSGVKNVGVELISSRIEALLTDKKAKKSA